MTYNFFSAKWDADWQCYVNVDSLEEITPGDRVTILKIPNSAAGVETVTAENSKKPRTSVYVSMHTLMI